MKIIGCFLAFVGGLLLGFPSYAKQDIKLSLTCGFDGIGYDGLAKDKIIEKFRYYSDVNESGEFKGFGIVKSEFESNGVKHEIDYTFIESSYATATSSKLIGKGLRRRLLVFTYIFDMESLQVDRIVSSLPEGLDERKQGDCAKSK